jgi:hypothetical protein
VTDAEAAPELAAVTAEVEGRDWLEEAAGASVLHHRGAHYMCHFHKTNPFHGNVTVDRSLTFQTC